MMPNFRMHVEIAGYLALRPVWFFAPHDFSFPPFTMVSFRPLSALSALFRFPVGEDGHTSFFPYFPPLPVFLVIKSREVNDECIRSNQIICAVSLDSLIKHDPGSQDLERE